MNTDELIEQRFSRPHAWHLEQIFEVRHGNDTLAHVEAGARVITVDDGHLMMGMVAWVACDPAFEGLHLVSGLMAAAHRWMIRFGCSYAGLFADIPRFYERFGYASAPNLGEWGMVKPFHEVQPWFTDGVVDLRGEVW